LQFAKNQLEEAKQTVIGKCIEINPLNYDQFLLLGDVYAAQNDIKQARENYLKAGNIRPNSPEYKKKMELLMTRKTETPAGATPVTNAGVVTVPTTK
jgi:cytochrome c-type biogenesis protein CcmH/NrfG